MGDHASKSLAGEPRVQVEGLGLDLEDFRPAWLELKSDRLFAGRANKQCLCMLIFFGSAELAMSPEITTRSGRGDKRFSVSIERASAAAISTRP